MKVGDLVEITSPPTDMPGLRRAKGTITEVTKVAVVRKAKGRGDADVMCADGDHTVETQTHKGRTGRWCTTCGHREQIMQMLTVDVGWQDVRLLSCYVRRLK